MYPIYRDARVIASAGICRSINEISRVVGIPVATVWRTIKDFERRGIVTIRQEGRNAQVFINNQHPDVQSFMQIAQNHQVRAMNPEKIVGDYFEQKAISYAFFGPTRTKYVGGQMTNQVWIAVKTEKDAKKVKEIIRNNEFTPVADVSETVGQATQKIVVKIAVIGKISSERIVGYRIADEATQQRAMNAIRNS